MDEIRSSARRISKATCAIDGAYDMISKRLGIKGNLLWLLYTLDDEALHSQKQICEEWLFPKTTINTLIQECKAKGYITLHTIPGQRREANIRLTPEGQRCVRQTLGLVYVAEEEALRKTLQTCPPEFIEYLETYTQNLKEVFADFIIRKDVP